MSSGERLRPLRDVLAISINSYQTHARRLYRANDGGRWGRYCFFFAPLSVKKNRTYTVSRVLNLSRWLRFPYVFVALLSSTILCARGQDNNSTPKQPRFLGPQSCSSSSCHGGAGENRDQYLVWSKYDFHHARP